MVTETMPDRTTSAVVYGAGSGDYIAGELRFRLEEDAREESQTFRVFQVSGQDNSRCVGTVYRIRNGWASSRDVGKRFVLRHEAALATIEAYQATLEGERIPEYDGDECESDRADFRRDA